MEGGNRDAGSWFLIASGKIPLVSIGNFMKNLSPPLVPEHQYFRKGPEQEEAIVFFRRISGQSVAF